VVKRQVPGLLLLQGLKRSSRQCHAALTGEPRSVSASNAQETNRAAAGQSCALDRLPGNGSLQQSVRTLRIWKKII